MLDIKNHYLNISAYLNQTQEVWEHEILERSPSFWPHRYQKMTEEIAQLSHYQKWKLLTDKSSYLTLPLSRELFQHFEKRDHLTRLSSRERTAPLKLPSWAFQKVRQKKQHEISILAQELNKLHHKLSPQQLVDIGGGQGHFARVMAHYFRWNTTSIEREEKFIALGLKRLQKHPAPKDAAKLKLIQLDFQGLETKNQDKLYSLFQKDVFSLGLHTCGPLAVRHIQTHRGLKTKGLLNFGCCYGKLKQASDLNLSPEAKNSPVQWSTPALNLAARAHSQLDYPDFCRQERVKSYRYALGLFLQSHFPDENLNSVGDSSTRDYLASFEHYAQKKFDFIQKSWSPQLKKELGDFYYSFSTREKLDQLFCADILRWSFGRILELGILLDRALYLRQDRDQKVELIQFFDESISPRNIGLLSYREELSDS